MNVYIVREQDMERVNAFATKKQAVHYLLWCGYRPIAK